MSDLLSTFSVSSSGMKAQATRIRHVSENIANADTPGFRRKLVSFEPAVEQGRSTGGVVTGPVRFDQGELAQIFEPSHPLANDAGYYLGSNVDLVLELADAREAQRSYEANLKVFDQARQMTTNLLDLLSR